MNKDIILSLHVFLLNCYYLLSKYVLYKARPKRTICVPIHSLVFFIRSVTTSPIPKLEESNCNQLKLIQVDPSLLNRRISDKVCKRLVT